MALLTEGVLCALSNPRKGKPMAVEVALASGGPGEVKGLSFWEERGKKDCTVRYLIRRLFRRPCTIRTGRCREPNPAFGWPDIERRPLGLVRLGFDVY